MFAKLPDYADPCFLCEKGSQFSGQIPLSELPRLLPLLNNDQGIVKYRLSFGKDDEGHYIIDNSVEATLNLLCQRCLFPFDYFIDSTALVCPVSGIQEAEQLPDHYEPLLLDEQQMRLVDLIEDELILSLPDVPMHAVGDCKIKLAELNQNQTIDSLPDTNGSETENPFAVLAQLKKKR